MLRRFSLLCLATAISTVALADRSSLPPMPKDPIIAAAFGRSTNDCESPRTPVIDRVDLNRDGRQDAIVWDRSPCYRKFGGSFAIVTEANGQWISLVHELGRPRWLTERNRGWPDFEVRDMSRDCFNLYRLIGQTYVHAYTEETRPEQCHSTARAREPALESVSR